ncbi:hypothetical protein CPC16_003955 [Podila verticillata]|nr:hypothetical protein CPC16_003955 [Podila verticillata]
MVEYAMQPGQSSGTRSHLLTIMPSAGAKAAFAEVSLSIMTSAKPFGIDMDFTTTVGYSYSQTSEETTTLKYDFDLVRSDPGYIVMVNAQARSELVRPDVIAAGLKM